MAAGGRRPGAGRKPHKIVHKILLRETQPGRYEQIERATDADLTPLAVMRENMVFFHGKAGELMATIKAMPLAADASFKRLRTWQASSSCER